MEQQSISLRDRVRHAIDNLPLLSPDAIPPDDTCPICLVSFSEILSAEKVIENHGNKVHRGIAVVAGCGHMFCMRDLAEWIENLHGSCPTCRHVFVDVCPPSESEYDSSDGGEYIPDEEEDEEDEFIDNEGFSDHDVDFEFDDMEIESESSWGDEQSINGFDSMEEWQPEDGEGDETFCDNDVSEGEK